MRLVSGESVFWRVSLEGETWDFDPEDLTVDQMIAIEAETGQSVDEWANEVRRGMGRAYKVLIWWLRGREIPVDSVNFRVGDLLVETVVRPVKKPPKAAGKRPATKPSPSS